MKTSRDPRHIHRIELMNKLFSLSFDVHQHSPELKNLWEHLQEIDAEIGRSAPEWPVSKIAKIDLAILRLAIYELTIGKKEPPKVIIDEAIELGKEFGNDHSWQFINGVLGTVLKHI